MSVPFKPGDRVRLNDFGISRCPRARVRKGVVVTSTLARSPSMSPTVLVRWQQSAHKSS